MDHQFIFIGLACLFGIIMTWGVGANDLANIMSTTIGSKAISIRHALWIAIIFEIAGALFGSNDVTETLRHGIINTQLLAHEPLVFIYGMLAVLLAGSVWMLTASTLGLPVSITNAIVGSIVGFGLIVLGPHTIHWAAVGKIATSWIASPLIAGIIAYGLFSSIQQLILGKRDPVAAAKRYLPIYLFLVSLILAIMVVLKGLHHFKPDLSSKIDYSLAAITAVMITAMGLLANRRFHLPANASRHERFIYIEKLFSGLMACTACAMVFAHGSNDVAIAVGPMSAVISTVRAGGLSNQPHSLELWIIVVGCGGVLLGFAMYGRRVIETVGSAITTLTPSRAFAASLAAASTVVVSTSIGIPVSATQTLVGGVLGVGLARGIGALNLNVIRNIFMSWMVTIPAASILTIIFFYGFTSLFAWL